MSKGERFGFDKLSQRELRKSCINVFCSPGSFFANCNSYVPVPREPEQEEPWLIFADRDGLGQTVATQLRAEGKRPIRVEQGDCYRALGTDHYQICPARRADWETLVNVIPGPAGVIYLWSLDIPAFYEGDVPADLALPSFGHEAVMNLVQSLAQHVETAPSRLWLVTRGSQNVTKTRRQG